MSFYRLNPWQKRRVNLLMLSDRIRIALDRIGSFFRSA